MTEKRLLIVDDDKTVLYAYKRLFQFAGVKVDTARSLKNAFSLMEKNDYRAMVTDLRLTENRNEGLEILQNMKNINPETKLILITAFGNYEVKEKAKEIGVDYYFEKPVPIDDLIKVLKSLTS
ncbi:MAG: response regulator [bacterium]|nr:response regulator [bacterium]